MGRFPTEDIYQSCRRAYTLQFVINLLFENVHVLKLPETTFHSLFCTTFIIFNTKVKFRKSLDTIIGKITFYSQNFLDRTGNHCDLFLNKLLISRKLLIFRNLAQLLMSAFFSDKKLNRVQLELGIRGKLGQDTLRLYCRLQWK